MAEKFVKLTKDGATIEVHPSVVEEHKSLGWKVVEETSEEKPKAATKPADKAETRTSTRSAGEKAEK